MEYMCFNCGECFDESEIKHEYEHHPYGMGTAAEQIDVCPYCGNSDIGEATRCKNCGEISQDKLVYGICPDCLKSLQTPQNCIEYIKDNGLLEDFIDYLGDFTDEEFLLNSVNSALVEYVCADDEHFATWYAIKYL